MLFSNIVDTYHLTCFQEGTARKIKGRSSGKRGKRPRAGGVGVEVVVGVLTPPNPISDWVKKFSSVSGSIVYLVWFS